MKRFILDVLKDTAKDALLAYDRDGASPVLDPLLGAFLSSAPSMVRTELRRWILALMAEDLLQPTTADYRELVA